VLCVVVDAAAPLAAITEAVAGGADWVQLRERALAGRPLLAWVEAARDAARAGAARRGDAGSLRVLVNRRVDVALAADADGVHLGFDAMDPAQARALLAAEGAATNQNQGGGRVRWIGVSTHAAVEVPVAARAGADYAQLAPIFAPLSKPAERAALGLGALAAARGAGIPVLAQGGIDADNAADAWRAGALGVAVTGAIVLSSDPGAAAHRLRRALDAAAAEGPA
jgi:thiamine-phosphate diphosphorylase